MRESKRKPREEGAEAPQEGAQPGDELQALRRRVVELTAENEALRRQLAALQASSDAEEGAELSAPF